MKYPEIFDTSDFDSWKQKYLRKELLSREWDLMTREELPDVISIPAFTQEFCDKFVENIKEEKFHQSDRWGTPTDIKSMETINMFDEMLKMVEEFFYPIMYHYWRIEGYKWKDLNVDPQILRFKPGQDLRLHHDFCAMTISCLLDETSRGGELVFEKYGNIIQKQGYVYIFPGQITHRYGMRRIKNQNRYLLNIYCYAH